MPLDFLIETDRAFFLGASARLVSDGERCEAWAETYVRSDPDIKWIVGNYVEADRANSNGHIFPLADLLDSQHTLINKPLNMLHADQYIIGAYAGAHLLTPDGETFTSSMLPAYAALTAAAAGLRPTMEALAGMWHKRFHDEYMAIKRAHGEGNLFFSMEAVPPTVTCPNAECAMTAEFVGLESETYCEHMNGKILPKILNQPVFCGGAIIIPPVRPGWNRADVKTISALVRANQGRAEAAYEAAKTLAPHLSASSWEAVMGELLMVEAESVWAKDYSTDSRKQMAKTGEAMGDGSFPIKNGSDMKNAIKLAGHAKDPAAAKAHIKKRAKSLNLTNMIPEGW